MSEFAKVRFQSRDNPCPICGQWGKYTCLETNARKLRDGTYDTSGRGNFFCVNVPNQNDVKFDVGGREGWLHEAEPQPRKFNPSYTPSKPARKTTPQPKAPSLPDALPDEIDLALTVALNVMAPPNEAHTKDLLRRGARPEWIEQWGFKQWGDVVKNSSSKYRNQYLADLVYKAVGNAPIPGFGIHKKGYRTCNLRMGKWLGMPIRDTQGRIRGIALKNHPDATEKDKEKFGKYGRLTKSKNDDIRGPKAKGNVHHCAIIPKAEQREHNPVIITEGPLKAYLSHIPLRCTVFGGEGKSFDLNALISDLHAVKAKDVIIAFDEEDDEDERRKTEESAAKLANSLAAAGGFSIQMASWDPQRGKGIDDFVQGGGTFEDLELSSPRLIQKKHIPVDEELVEYEALPPSWFGSPSVPKEEQWEETERLVIDFILRRDQYKNTTLLLGTAPGQRKSSIAKGAILKAARHDPNLRVMYNGYAHKTIQPEPGDGHMQGRNQLKPDGSPVCVEAGGPAAKAGVPWSQICGSCRLRSVCAGESPAPPFGRAPNYLSKFPKKISDVKTRTFTPIQNYYNPDKIKPMFQPHVIVQDDVDLLSYIDKDRVIITDPHLADNIREAKDDEYAYNLNPLSEELYLAPALPLLELFQGFLRHIIDQAFRPDERQRGAELAKMFFAWCVDQGASLDDVALWAHEAEKVEYRNPFEKERLEDVKVCTLQIANDLGNLVLNEMSHYSAGESTWSSVFNLKALKGGSLALEVSRLYNLAKVQEEWGDTPEIVANADLTREELQRIRPGRKVIEYRPLTHWPENAEVYLYTKNRYSKTRLLGPDSSDRERIFKDVQRLLEVYKDSTFGIVTFKAFFPLLKERFPNESRIVGMDDDTEPLYFGNVRSRNELDHVSDLIVIGTPWPNRAELEREAEAIYYNQDPLDKTRVPKKWKLRDASGKETVIQMDCYRDPRLQERLMRVWYHEFNQAAFRSRPLSVDDTGQLELGDDGKEAPKKRLHLFAQVIPAMPITQIIDGEIESVPELHADVLRVIREHCQEHDRLPTQEQIVEAVSTADSPVTKGQVNNVYKWVNKREGAGWREGILEDVRAGKVDVKKPPAATEKPSCWSTIDVIPPQTGGNSTAWRAKEPQPAPKRATPPTEPVERNTS